MLNENSLVKTVTAEQIGGFGGWEEHPKADEVLMEVCVLWL